MRKRGLQRKVSATETRLVGSMVLLIPQEYAAEML